MDGWMDGWMDGRMDGWTDTQNFCQGSYVQHRLIRYLCIYTACTNLAFNGSFALQHFEYSNAIEIMFNFYLELPHIPNKY